MIDCVRLCAMSVDRVPTLAICTGPAGDRSVGV